MARWNHDGTQDPGPPPLMADPLSGLVTGGKYDGEAVRVRVVEPAKPDIEAVREAMESVLDENSELRIDLPPLVNPAPAAEREPAPKVDKTPPPTPPAGIPVPAARVGTPPPEIPVQRGSTSRPPRRGWSPGLALVGLLLLVMVVLAIVMFASLIDSISAIFS
jgi:hypothetical protein